MPRHNYYAMGDHNGSCDQCGRVFKMTHLQQRWDNLMCCPACWEIRQPQDFLRGIPDDQHVEIARPRALPSQVYLSVPAGAGNMVQQIEGPLPTFSTYFEAYATIALGDWTPTASVIVFSLFRGSPPSQNTLYLAINTAGAMTFVWTDSAGTATVVNSTADLSATAANSALYLLWTFSYDGGTATNKFWYSLDGNTYTQLGATVTTPGVLPLANKGLPATIGNFANGANGPATELRLYDLTVNAAAGNANMVSFLANLGAPYARQIQTPTGLYQLFGSSTNFVQP